MVANTDQGERLHSLAMDALALCRQRSRTPEQIQTLINALRKFRNQADQPFLDRPKIKELQINKQWIVLLNLCTDAINLEAEEKCDAIELENLLNYLQEFKNTPSCQKQRQIIPEHVNPTKCPKCGSQMPEGEEDCGLCHTEIDRIIIYPVVGHK